MNASRYIADDLADKIRAGNRRALARAITLIESTHTQHKAQAEELIQTLLPDTGNSIRLGVSGVPGVGKSTFIEALGQTIIAQGHRLAVLSIDPSSSISGGSILGDKTRMEQLARNPAAYIRPSPSGNTFGGVARRSREAMLLCEAAGFDVLIIETVGVGQTETAVAEMTDMFLLLLLPAGGDELQGIKRGIMELADLILINKSDGDWQAAARRAAADYRNALRLLQARSVHWQPRVELCSALTGAGIDEVWQQVIEYRQCMTGSGAFEQRRQQQASHWLWQELKDSLLDVFTHDPAVQAQLPVLQTRVKQGQLAPAVAARQMLDAFLQHKK